MLERTSACLDNGVRLSLRAQRHMLKTRRSLHQSFWSTQAPDVDLPPCHLSLLAPAASPSAFASSSSSSSSAVSFDPQDAPFLDFLYPAPTQAFMTRLSQWDKWPRRNTRLPVFRGYSSLTTPQDSSQDSPQDSPQDHDPPSHQGLRNLLALDSTVAINTDIERAWQLCSHLDSEDNHLLRQALFWFSRRKDYSASIRTVELFDRLPEEHRSPLAYRAAVAANLRLDRESDAISLHEHASNLSPSDSIGSELLMTHAVTKENWSLALSILELYQKYTATSKPPVHVPSLWSAVRSLSDLDAKLDSLLRHCQTKSKQTSDSGLHHLFGLMLNEFVLSRSRSSLLFEPDSNGDAARGKVRQLIYRMHRAKIASTDGFERILLTLLTFERGPTHPGFSAIIVFTYLLYRRSGRFNPSKEVLRRMLKYWKNHMIAFAGHGPSRSFVGLQRIVSDWNRFHNDLNDEALVDIMDAFARVGNVEAVETYAAMYKSFHPEGPADSSKLWPLIYVHAMLAKPVEAAEQLERIKQDFGVQPDVRCWNIVIHAYQEANDLSGALDVFARMTDDGIKPDVYTYGPLLSLYAKRGDIDGVIDLLDLAKSSGITQPTVHMLNSMIVALVTSNDIDGARQALERTVQAVEAGEALGSLTICFNTMLVAYALQRDLRATMDTYRRMRSENIPLDEHSFGALIQVLSSFRQTPMAHKILKRFMPHNKIRPKAFHYAIIMTGYTNQGLYGEALAAEREMEEARIRATVSTRAIALKAKTLHEHTTKREETDESGKLVSLEDTIADYQRLLNDAKISPPGNQPLPGYRHESSGTRVVDAAYLIYIHGARRSFEAIQEIFRMYQDKLSQAAEGAPMMRLLTALMSVHSRAGEHVEVDRYWELIKSRADQLRTSHPHPSAFKKRSNPTDPIRRARATPQIAPAYRLILSQPLRYYIISQFQQSSSSKIISTVLELLSAGYAFDNRTWNTYIVHLCQTSPPRALLAYSLVERFMINDWPGWITARRGVVTNKTIFPRKAARAEGLEYIKARYLRPGQLVPQYRTMVYLARALLEVRGLETSGMSIERSEKGRELRELKRQVGSIREIREKAPRTLHAAQSMPRVFDSLQSRLLGQFEY